MQNKAFDISRAPQIPSRADARFGTAPPLGAQPGRSPRIRQIDASPSGLLRSTLIASAAAIGVLTVFYLPAEYGIDPTGLGAVLGLTEMGQIKQQLVGEASQDVAAQTALTDPAIITRLDRMEAQIAAIAAVIGAESGRPAETAAGSRQAAPFGEEQASSELAAGPAMTDQAPPQHEMAAFVAKTAETPTGWRNEASYTLSPGQGVEIKLVMQEGQTARFQWTANGGVLNYATHGDGGGREISYEDGRAIPEQSGELTAAFTGNHGWFWRNRTEAPVTLTLRTGGDYAEFRAP